MKRFFVWGTNDIPSWLLCCATSIGMPSGSTSLDQSVGDWIIDCEMFQGDLERYGPTDPDIRGWMEVVEIATEDRFYQRYMERYADRYPGGQP